MRSASSGSSLRASRGGLARACALFARACALFARACALSVRACALGMRASHRIASRRVASSFRLVRACLVASRSLFRCPGASLSLSLSLRPRDRLIHAANPARARQPCDVCTSRSRGGSPVWPTLRLKSRASGSVRGGGSARNTCPRVVCAPPFRVAHLGSSTDVQALTGSARSIGLIRSEQRTPASAIARKNEENEVGGVSDE